MFSYTFYMQSKVINFQKETLNTQLIIINNQKQKATDAHLENI